jgi:TRAP-type C4-dicarboxylate transport system permease small subunit
MLESYKKFLAILAGLSLFNLFIIMLASTISRYFFNSSILWAEELSKYSMIYGVMFGMVVCYLDGLHIKFGVLNSVTSKRMHNIFEMAIDSSVLVCSVILFYSGYLFTVKRGAIESPGIGISMYYFYSAILIGSICLMIAALFRLALHIKVTRRSTQTTI